MLLWVGGGVLAGVLLLVTAVLHGGLYTLVRVDDRTVVRLHRLTGSAQACRLVTQSGDRWLECTPWAR